MSKTQYKKYPAYKDSGIEWIGEIPEHWGVTKFRIITEIITCGHAATPDYFDDGVMFLSAQNIRNEKLDLFQYNYISKELHSQLTKHKQVKKGDLLQVRVGGSTTIGQTCIVDIDAEFSIYVSLCHIRLKKKAYNRYIKHLCNSTRFKEYCSVEMKKGAGVANLNVSDLERYRLPLPTTDEQQAIADYLDEKTALIDTLIDKKKRQIELLKEQRQAVINQAVTKGLDPNCEMKDSGIEWLGEIPKHWEVKKGKYLFNIISGYAPEQIKFSDNNDNLYFRVDDLNDDSDGLFLSNSKAKFILRDIPLYHNNIVLFPKRGAAIFTNKVKITKKECLFDTNLMGLSVFCGVANIEYISFCLLSRRLDDIADTSTIPQINNKHIYPLPFPYPSIEEQDNIVSYIYKQIDKIDTSIIKAEKQIQLLQEYRTALISEAVTGKIDVRKN